MCEPLRELVKYCTPAQTRCFPREPAVPPNAQATQFSGEGAESKFGEVNQGVGGLGREPQRGEGRDR